MLSVHPYPAWGIPDTMTTRTAALVTIGLTMSLLATVAIAAIVSPEISERNLGIITAVLTTFGTVITGMLILLRLETVSGKADETASKVKEVHHDLLNGGLRENIKRAYEEIEDDPVILARRVELSAMGVQKDRHDKANREARKPIREQLEARGMPKRPEKP